MHAAPVGGPVHDPYRGRSAAAAFAPFGSTARHIYLAFLVLAMLGFVTAIGGWTAAIASAGPYGTPDDSLLVIGGVAFAGTLFMVYGMAFTGVYWVYKAWSWLPPDQRWTRHWKGWISPAQAALLLLVPYFQYYWMFVIDSGLCDSLDRLRVTYPTRDAAPKSLAIAAAICQILIPLPVGAILWLVFMNKVERMMSEMGTATVPAMPHG